MKTQSLPIELPRIDADTQNRLAINTDVVEEYAALIIDSDGEWPFPPIDVFHDGTDYYVADGFHRLLGALRTKRGTIPCRVHQGTAIDAKIFGMTANDKHGLRMTRADKKACVEWLLDNGDKMTQAEIADAAGVSVRTVRTIVSDRKYASTPPTPTPDARGGDRQVAAIPTGGEEPEPIDDAEPAAEQEPCPDCKGTDFHPDGSCRSCPQPDPETPTAIAVEDIRGLAAEPGEDEAVEEPEAAEESGTWLTTSIVEMLDEWREEYPLAQKCMANVIWNKIMENWKGA